MSSRSTHTVPGTLVSVIIPAYNVQDILQRAVTSVLEQSWTTLEVIVVDDASQDETAKRVEEIARRDKRVRLLRSATNGGPGAARALGLAHAGGDWIAILDADDRFSQTRIESLLAIAYETEADAIADNLMLIDPATDEVAGTAFPLAPGARVSLDPGGLVRNSVPGGRINLGWCQPMVRAAFLRNRGITWRSFRHAEDFLFDMEILLNGGRFILVGEPLYQYTQRWGTISRAASPYSRTVRSIAEQQSVIDELLQGYLAAINPSLRARLARMREQIEVASRLQDMRDAWYRRNLSAFTAAFLTSLRNPRALTACVIGRYGPGAGRLS